MNESTYKKANLIIDSRYKMSLEGNKAMMLALASAEMQKGRLVSKMPVSMLAPIFSATVKTGRFYTHLKNLAAELTDQKLLIEDIGKNSFKLMNLIGVASYNNGTLEIKFEPDATQYIRDLKTNYTILNIPLMMSLTNPYAFRLYEILKSRAYLSKSSVCDCNTYYAQFSFSDLRLLIGGIDLSGSDIKKELKNNQIKAETLENISAAGTFSDNSKYIVKNFISRILKPAVEEINEKTDLNVQFEYERYGLGAKIHGIIFIFNKKVPAIEKE